MVRRRRTCLLLRRDHGLHKASLPNYRRPCLLDCLERRRNCLRPSRRTQKPKRKQQRRRQQPQEPRRQQQPRKRKPALKPVNQVPPLEDAPLPEEGSLGAREHHHYARGSRAGRGRKEQLQRGSRSPTRSRTTSRWPRGRRFPIEPRWRRASATCSASASGGGSARFGNCASSPRRITVAPIAAELRDADEGSYARTGTSPRGPAIDCPTGEAVHRSPDRSRVWVVYASAPIFPRGKAGRRRPASLLCAGPGPDPPRGPPPA